MVESDNSDADNANNDGVVSGRPPLDGDRGAADRRRGNLSVGALLTYATVTLLCALSAAVLPQPRMAAGTQLYTNTFSVRLHGPSNRDGHVDEQVAHQVAKRAGSGFENIGKVGER